MVLRSDLSHIICSIQPTPFPHLILIARFKASLVHTFLLTCHIHKFLLSAYRHLVDYSVFTPMLEKHDTCLGDAVSLTLYTITPICKCLKWDSRKETLFRFQLFHLPTGIFNGLWYDKHPAGLKDFNKYSQFDASFAEEKHRWILSLKVYSKVVIQNITSRLCAHVRFHWISCLSGVARSDNLVSRNRALMRFTIRSSDVKFRLKSSTKLNGS